MEEYIKFSYPYVHLEKILRNSNIAYPVTFVIDTSLGDSEHKDIA